MKYDKKGEYVRIFLPELKELPDCVVQVLWLIEKDKFDEL